MKKRLIAVITFALVLLSSCGGQSGLNDDTTSVGRYENSRIENREGSETESSARSSFLERNRNCQKKLLIQSKRKALQKAKRSRENRQVLPANRHRKINSRHKQGRNNLPVKRPKRRKSKLRPVKSRKRKSQKQHRRNPQLLPNQVQYQKQKAIHHLLRKLRLFMFPNIYSLQRTLARM